MSQAEVFILLILSFVAGILFDALWLREEPKEGPRKKKHRYFITFSVHKNGEEIAHGGKLLEEEHTLWVDDIRFAREIIGGNYDEGAEVILHSVNYLGEKT